MNLNVITLALLLLAVGLQIAAAKLMPENQAAAGILSSIVLALSSAIFQKKFEDSKPEGP